MATYNISRITSEVLRMIGGSIRWVGGVLHITSEDGNDPAGINVDKVEFQNGVTLSGPDTANVPHEIKLPNEPGQSGEAMVNDGTGQLVWGAAASNQLVADAFNMNANQLTYTLSGTVDASRPIIAQVNGISVNFTMSGNNLTITTYTPGEIDGTEELKVYYYHD